WAATPPGRGAVAGSHAGSRCWGSARCSRCPPSDSPAVEVAALAGAVPLERSLGPDRIGPLEDPVLPRGEAREDLALERLRPAEAQRGLHAGQGVRRERGALLDRDAHLVLPVDV